MNKVGGLGAKLLEKLGWREGSGLGLKGDGLIEPLRASRRNTPAKPGIGPKRKEEQWWEHLMKEVYETPKNGQSVDLFAACEGRRCRPHGCAKLARLQAQDQAFMDLKTPPQGEGDAQRAQSASAVADISEQTKAQIPSPTPDPLQKNAQTEPQNAYAQRTKRVSRVERRTHREKVIREAELKPSVSIVESREIRKRRKIKRQRKTERKRAKVNDSKTI